MTPPNLSIFLIMACFWVTLWIVQRFLIVPLGAVLKERRERIEGAEAEWSSKNEEYLSATARLESEMEEAAREAAAIRGTYLQQAMTQRQETLGNAREAAGKKLDAALAELEADAATARAELRQQASNLARQLASKLLDREVKQGASS